MVVLTNYKSTPPSYTYQNTYKIVFVLMVEKACFCPLSVRSEKSRNWSDTYWSNINTYMTIVWVIILTTLSKWVKFSESSSIACYQKGNVDNGYKPMFSITTIQTLQTLTWQTRLSQGRAAGQGSESIKSISLFYLDISNQMHNSERGNRALHNTIRCITVRGGTGHFPW